MFNKFNSYLPGFFCQNYAYRRLGLALGLSLLLHFLVFQDIPLQLPSPKSTPQPVEVQLIAPMPVLPKTPTSNPGLVKPKAQPAPASPAAPKPETKQPPPAEAAAKPLLSESSSQLLPDSRVVEAPVVAEDIAREQVQSTQEPGMSDSVAENVSVEDEPLQADHIYVATEFDISRSVGGSKVGKTRVVYQSHPDGSYTINSVSEAQGLLSLFLSGKLVQYSEGVIAEQGLQPQQFLYQYGDEAKKKQHALFDWQAGEVALETKKGVEKQPLPQGTQDLLSFMYQFMFVPPLEQMQLSVTNGKKVSNYTYSFEGEERLRTGMGELNTVHILSAGDEGEEKTELWLAVDYDYVPVKMRKTEEDGSVVEQIATHISTEP